MIMTLKTPKRAPVMTITESTVRSQHTNTETNDTTLFLPLYDSREEPSSKPINELAQPRADRRTKDDDLNQ